MHHSISPLFSLFTFFFRLHFAPQSRAKNRFRKMHQWNGGSLVGCTRTCTHVCITSSNYVCRRLMCKVNHICDSCMPSALLPQRSQGLRTFVGGNENWSGKIGSRKFRVHRLRHDSAGCACAVAWHRMKIAPNNSNVAENENQRTRLCTHVPLYYRNADFWSLNDKNGVTCPLPLVPTYFLATTTTTQVD